MSQQDLADVTVVILTYNEEANLAQALRSVASWARDVFVLDSGSQDRTVAVAEELGARVFTHRFKDYASQRNHALTQLPITTEWIFFLDADEWVTPELRSEISTTLAGHPAQNGFYIRRRFIWMGKWIRRGYYPTWILRLFRKGYGRCEERSVNEHLIVEGETARLESDFIHEDLKSLERWVSKHNQYAKLEAAELLRAKSDSKGTLQGRLGGTQAERKRWLRERVWNHLPPFVRPPLYFSYRSVLAGGFLDGPGAMGYHFLQALWFPVLTDLYYVLMREGRMPIPGGLASEAGAERAGEVKSLFDQQSKVWANKYAPEGQLRGRLALFRNALAEVPKGSAVLDLGCGSGNLVEALVGQGFTLTGADISEDMLAAARTSVGEGVARWDLLPTDWLRLPYEDASFDAVVASSVLEYVELPGLFLAECSRVLKPGGLLLFTVPDPKSAVRRLERLASVGSSAGGMGERIMSQWGERLPRAARYLRYLSVSKNRLSEKRWLEKLTATGFAGERARTEPGLLPGPLMLLRGKKWSKPASVHAHPRAKSRRSP